MIISALFVELLFSDGVALLNSNQLPHEGESDDNFSDSLWLSVAGAQGSFLPNRFDDEQVCHLFVFEV